MSILTLLFTSQLHLCEKNFLSVIHYSQVMFSFSILKPLFCVVSSIKLSSLMSISKNWRIIFTSHNVSVSRFSGLIINVELS